MHHDSGGVNFMHQRPSRILKMPAFAIFHVVPLPPLSAINRLSEGRSCAVLSAVSRNRAGRGAKSTQGLNGLVLA